MRCLRSLVDCSWQAISLKSWFTRNHRPHEILSAHCFSNTAQLDTRGEWYMTVWEVESLWSIMRSALRPPRPQPGILRSVCCLKGLWNVEQILWALSAWARSPLARLKSQGPARELTEFHMEARNRGTSCLRLTACPTLTLICRRPCALASFLFVGLCVTVWNLYCVLVCPVQFLCAFLLCWRTEWFLNWSISRLKECWYKSTLWGIFASYFSPCCITLYTCGLWIFGETKEHWGIVYRLNV